MWPHRAIRIVLLATLLAGAVSGSSPPPTIISRSDGELFEATLLTFSDDVEKCYIVTPSNDTVIFKPSDESSKKYELLDDTDVMKCGARVLDLDKSDTGLWTVHSVSAKGNLRSQSYQVRVNVPEELSEEKDVPDIILDLDKLRFDTELNSWHIIQIPYIDFINTEECYIVTPDNKRVSLESQNIPGVQIIRDLNFACGINITVKEELLGQWALISRETRLTPGYYQRVLPFIISVTEEVNAIPNNIGVIESKDFYVRLENAIPNPETCRLLRPDGSEYVQFENDARFVDTCGYIVRNVNQSDNGRWRIEYGNRIIYSAPIQVIVYKKAGIGQNQNETNFVWTRDRPVQQIFGSNNATYCKVVDAKGYVAFEGFGRCNITFPRATNEHEGDWKMFVGLSGRVLTDEYVFSVRVIDGASKAIVETKVSSNNPFVTLSCSVSSPYPIRACKFRSPSGRILMANPGVGEDQYTFHGTESSYQSGIHTHDCGIQINNPPHRDLGFWRCAIETDNETYYGFISARWPWAWRDPEVVAGVKTEPTLNADRRSLEVFEGDSVLVSCSAESALRYCYFRSSNGTIYNVGPGVSSTDMGDYAGAGLDAGECSIRFRSLTVADSGPWSCHVGFQDIVMTEQRDNFNVTVKDIMIVTQAEIGILTVDALVEGRRLDYCRFVRSDGFGFSSDAVPIEYSVKLGLSSGRCTLRILAPTRVDRRPWTVVAKITGHNEVSRTTNATPMLPPPPQNHLTIFWLLMLSSGLILIMTAAFIVPEKNRRWTYARAATIRTSFRQTFAKRAATEQNVTDRTSANAA